MAKGGEVRVRVAADGTAAYIVSTEATAVSPDDLAELLSAEGITYGIDAAALESAAEAISEPGSPPQNMAVATGIEPKPGADGRIDFFVDVMTTPHYAVDKRGNVNFHEPNVINNVEEGKPLARLVAPEDGVPGRSVMDEAILAASGTPAKLRASKGVAESPDEPGLYAAKLSGRPVYEAGELSVTETIEVETVDYSTGDIDFSGLVVIRGDVLDGFSVRGGRGIEIGGTVGSATLESDGLVMIRGGVAGHEKAVIRTGGDLSAHYIGGATVECGGDIVVANEIVNSQIRCLGRISIEKGVIMGGDTVALGGVDCKDLGSDLGTRTVVTAGVHHVLEREGPGLSERIEELREDVSRLKTALGGALKDPATVRRMPAPRRRQLTQLAAEMKQATSARDEALGELKALQEAQGSGRPVVRATGIVHPGCEVHLRGAVLTTKDAWNGPLSFVRNEGAKKVELVSDDGASVTGDDAPPG